ncbi:MAG TPA: hypothetical protein VN374_02320, partial [Desulfitobacteriaceae bacterium]|nr:hypothetical protein [Desulfitobacteriaceae bacterium]
CQDCPITPWEFAVLRLTPLTRPRSCLLFLVFASISELIIEDGNVRSEKNFSGRPKTETNKKKGAV